MDSSLYTRPAKPLRMAVTSRRTEPGKLPEISKPLEVSSTSQCFVTPMDIAARMVEYLDASCDEMTLEPSAGTGNLVQALIDSGHSTFEITAIERDRELFHAMQKRTKVAGGMVSCFLDYAKEYPSTKGHFSRILINPPFKGIKQHMDTAISMLGPSGHHSARLIALVPITYKHADAQTLEELPVDAFAGIQVHTKIVEIERCT